MDNNKNDKNNMQYYTFSNLNDLGSYAMLLEK